MICEFRNKLERYVDYILVGHTSYSEIRSETTLFMVLFWIIFAIIATMGLPLRLINIKFVCDKKSKINRE